MKKIYLVKKDINKPLGEGNWITMTPFEFAQFMKTPEGRNRKNNFGQIDACEYDESIVVAECGEKMAKKLRAERDARNLRMNYKKKSGFTLFSYNELESVEDNLTGEELLEDEEIDVEGEAIDLVLISRIKEVVELLPAKEKHVIEKIYLSKNCLSVEEYIKKFNYSKATVYDRRNRAFEKIKKLLNN